MFTYKAQMYSTVYKRLIKEKTVASHRHFSRRGNQITAIKHNKIFNCSERVACYHSGWPQQAILKFVSLGLVAVVCYIKINKEVSLITILTSYCQLITIVSRQVWLLEIPAIEKRGTRSLVIRRFRSSLVVIGL